MDIGLLRNRSEPLVLHFLSIMGEPFFRFRQFVVYQDYAAMRVSTDSVLLGAWLQASRPARVLDIGCGTGVLALMTAQRFPEAQIDAVEMEEGACKDAARNFAASPWSSRLQLFHAGVQDWAESRPGLAAYDLIVCNPPYFVNSLEPDRPARRRARHQTDLTLSELVRLSARLLSDSGHSACILPAERQVELHELLTQQGLYLHRLCRVRTRRHKPVTRILTEWGKATTPLREEEHILLEEGQHQYSAEHRAMTSDFYLANQG